MSELIPCPFCGGEAKTEQLERIHYGTVYRVGCCTEGCRGWWYESVLYRTEAKAIEAWNTRAEKWRDLVWKLYAALGYARQFGEFSVLDGAVVDGILIGCSGIIEELPQLEEIRFGQMQSAADMLKQSQRWDEAQATADMLEKLNNEIARQSLNTAGRGCPMCEEERRKESQDEQG